MDAKERRATRIIVVNDTPIQRLMLRSVLEKSGYQVDDYEGPEQALEAMRLQLPPDLIITDLHMPGIDGWRFCRLLRSLEYAAFNQVPILINSATFGGEDTQTISNAAGADAFLEVPYRVEDLLQFVADLVAGKKPKKKTPLLIVEDSHTLADSLGRLMEESGYTPFVAYDGASARLLFAQHGPLVVLLDHHLPDATGLELLTEFAAQNARAVYILMTGDDDPELAILAMKSGASAYLRKPYSLSYLTELVHKAQREKSLLAIEALLEQRTQKLLTEERYHRTIMEAAHEGFCIAIDGVVRYANPALERIIGEPIGKLLGMNLFAFVVEEDRERVQDIYRRYQDGEGGLGIQPVSLKRADGEPCQVELSGGHLDYEGQPALLLVIRDVSERRQAEEQRSKLESQLQQAMKMEAVGRLAGGVAHDFNNLLTGITGNVELVQMELGASDPLHEALEEISKAAQSAATLTRQLLAFSRKQLIEPKVLDLNGLIRNLHKMLTRLIGEDIDLQTIPGKRLGAVKVDPGQFEQILVNLAINARDAMPDGGKLLIETANIDLDEEYTTHHPHVQAGRYVMLAVSDTGSGMSQDVKNHLFEPFFTTKPKGRGTGLGLATIYGAVKQAGGSVEAYSEEGQGTTFKIYLPQVDEKAERLEREGRFQEMPGGNETVLLVEDEQIVRDLAVRILKRLGYKVLSAADGKQAISLAKDPDERIDLMMTDVVMPGMNGRQLAEHLLLTRPEMKILYTSGYTENAIAHHGILDQGLSFLGKPYTPQVLAKKLRVVLGQK